MRVVGGMCGVTLVLFSFFFFSSRRRHTRCYRDWSSDVCSSDLAWPGISFSSSGVNYILAPVSICCRIIENKKPLHFCKGFSYQPTNNLHFRLLNGFYNIFYSNVLSF